MACGYCRGERNDLADNRGGDYLDGVTVVLTREYGPWEIVATGYYDGGYKCGSQSVRVVYCPMCGRRLEVEEEER